MRLPAIAVMTILAACVTRRGGATPYDYADAIRSAVEPDGVEGSALDACRRGWSGAPSPRRASLFRALPGVGYAQADVSLLAEFSFPDHSGYDYVLVLDGDVVGGMIGGHVSRVPMSDPDLAGLIATLKGGYRLRGDGRREAHRQDAECVFVTFRSRAAIQQVAFYGYIPWNKMTPASIEERLVFALSRLQVPHQ